MGLGGFSWSNVLDSTVPPQRLKPDTWLEHQDPASHTAQKKMKKVKRNKQTKPTKTNKQKKKQKKKKPNRQNPRTKGKSKPIQAKSHQETYTYTLTQEKKERENIYIKKEESNQTINKSTNDNKH